MLPAGSRLGPYEIVAPLGAGGMGEVYKALDKRLDRTVAIKVLPAQAAVDPAFRERFEREARAVSALNHPHICALYDVGTAPSADAAGPEIQFLVMEFVEGETLEARLAAKPSGLPVREALPIAMQIADALDKAHRAGIVHRDLKPGNVIITKTGAGSTSSPQAKLLDFGLAKSGAGGAGRAGGAGGAGGAGRVGGTGRAGGAGRAGGTGAAEPPDISALVTAPGTLTVQGTLLGTVQYMSPEQVEGREADTRSDLFAFGALLYEMVTGRKAFAGKSQASVMVAILEQDPPAMASLQPLAPPALDYIVSRCLAKDPDDRWQTARDLLAELKRTADAAATSAAAPPSAIGAQPTRRRELVLWGLLATSVVTAIALVTLYVGRERPTARVIRFEMPTPAAFSSAASLQLALSPDGQRLAYVAPTADGRVLLWVRSLDDVGPRSLAGTENPFHPFWSPDSRSIGFFSGGKLKTVDLAGGVPHTVCEYQGGYGGTWGADGTVLFGSDGPLMRVSSGGGQAVAVTTLDETSHETGHRWPFFLPDGRHFIFQAWISQLEVGGIYLGTVDSPGARRVTASDGQAQYSPPGYLLFPRETTLVSQAFDVNRGQVSGDVTRIADDIALGIGNGKAAFSVSANGILAFRSGGAQAVKTNLTWFDRSGKRLGTVGTPGDFRNPSLSPDGKRVAIDRSEGAQTNNRDVWIYDLASGNPSRFTFEPSDDSDVVWSPDGQRIAYGSRTAEGGREVRIKPASGLGPEEVVVNSKTAGDRALPSATGLFPRDWSPDGRFLLYDVFGAPGTGQDIWIVPLSGDRKPQPLLQTPANETEARFSPDGRWFVYQSNASGRPEIYVQPFPATGAKFQVSNGGGNNPKWRRDGKELFFYGPDGSLMAVDVRVGSTFEAGVPKALFPTSFAGLAGTGGFSHYGVSDDGQRFLVNVPVDQTAAPITVVVNWSEELKQRVPTR